MIIPCIDLMGGKVVQLVQGRDKALEVESVNETLEKFKPFPQIQVIDLDAAMGRGANDDLVEHLTARCEARVGGGVRTVARARQLIEQGAYRVIVGTSAFSSNGPNYDFLADLCKGVGAHRLLIALDSKDGRIVVRGWKESTTLRAEDVIASLEPYCSGFLCTYVDKEGMMQGTDLAWFERLRKATNHEITAAGGITTMDDIRVLSGFGIHCAIGMAIYTGKLDLGELAALQAHLGTL
jgi:phosphoribosylformimino-5-aminoimidazole carboxamide ribotide isomerase